MKYSRLACAMILLLDFVELTAKKHGVQWGTFWKNIILVVVIGSFVIGFVIDLRIMTKERKHSKSKPGYPKQV